MSQKLLPPLLILVILLLSSLVYFNALSGDFVYDDVNQIVNNPWVKDIRSMPAIFSKSVWSFEGDTRDNYYRPLMHIVFMFNYAIFGLNPAGFHLVNILFHAGNSVLIFLIAAELIEKKSKQYAVSSGQPQSKAGGNLSRVTLHPSRVTAFIATLLFATHPIHTEAVTWISGLPDVAFSFFYLSSLYLYIVFREGSGKTAYLLSVLSFSVSTLFKEPALTLPALLMAYDYLFGKFEHTFSGCVKRYLPYTVVVILYLLARYNALKGFAPAVEYYDLSVYEFIINGLSLFAEYLKSLFWPFKLNLWHSFYPIYSIFEPEGIVSLFVTVIFLGLAAAAYRKSKALFFSLLLLVLPLAPVLYFKGIGGKPFAERYLCLPSAGFVMPVAFLLLWLRKKLPHAVKYAIVLFVFVTGAYALTTIERNKVWKNNLTLLLDTVAKSPDSVFPHVNLGVAYADRGRLDAAIEQYHTALSIDPFYAPEPYFYLGEAYASQGRLDEAIEQYRTAVSIVPLPKFHRALGKAYERKGLMEQAVYHYEMALALERQKGR